MKVVYLTANPPVSPDRGDTMIAFNQLRGLAGKAEVHLVTFVYNDQEEQQLRHALGKYCASIHAVRDNPYCQIARLPRTLWNGLPLQVNRYSARRMRRALREVVAKEDIDLVHIQTMRMAHLCKGLNVPCTVDFIDALSLNMKRRAEREQRPWLTFPLWLESVLTRRYEQHLLRVCRGFAVISEADRQWLGDDKIRVIPSGTVITPEVLANYSEIERQRRFIFHGNMYYFPNVEGVLMIARRIWPALHARFPDHAFYVVGHKPAAVIQALNGKDNIIVTGSVDDMVAELCAAEMGLYWLDSGTGLQTKILEALACGLPVVASPLAVQGMPGLTGEHIVIADTPEAFAGKVTALMGDPERRAALGAAGQAHVNAHYSWARNVAALVSLWQDAL